MDCSKECYNNNKRCWCRDQPFSDVVYEDPKQQIIEGLELQIKRLKRLKEIFLSEENYIEVGALHRIIKRLENEKYNYITNPGRYKL